MLAATCSAVMILKPNEHKSCSVSDQLQSLPGARDASEARALYTCVDLTCTLYKCASHGQRDQMHTSCSSLSRSERESSLRPCCLLSCADCAASLTPAASATGGLPPSRLAPVLRRRTRPCVKQPGASTEDRRCGRRSPAHVRAVTLTQLLVIGAHCTACALRIQVI